MYKNNPLRLVKLYSLLAIILGATGTYEGFRTQQPLIITFGIALLISSIFLLIMLNKKSLYLVVALVTLGTVFWIWRIITDPLIGLLNPSREPLETAFKSFVSATILIPVLVVIIPTIYILTKRNFLK